MPFRDMANRAFACAGKNTILEYHTRVDNECVHLLQGPHPCVVSRACVTPRLGTVWDREQPRKWRTLLTSDPALPPGPPITPSQSMPHLEGVIGLHSPSDTLGMLGLCADHCASCGILLHGTARLCSTVLYNAALCGRSGIPWCMLESECRGSCCDACDASPAVAESWPG